MKPLRYWLVLSESKVGLGPRRGSAPREGHRFEVREISGIEAMSKLFRFDVRFGAERELALDPEQLVRTEASILMERDEEVRWVDGIVTEVKVGATIRGVQETRVVVEPRLALSRYRTDIRIFRDKTAVDAIVEVLALYGIEPILRLRDQYTRRPYNVQFRESDLNFVCRLMEDEGIFYYFLEDDRLVLGDSPAAYDEIAGDLKVPFRTGLGLEQHQDAVLRMGTYSMLAPSQVTLRDFNPDHPKLDMDATVAVASPTDSEYYDYPGEYVEPEEGQRKVRLWGEAFGCAAEGYKGQSTCARFVPGHCFTLWEAPQEVGDGKYLITRVQHDFHRAREGFSCQFEAKKAESVFRPLRETYVPRITNPLTGIVTCPPGEDDIHTDNMGRVKVHFHWDRLFPLDDTCSHWVPVIQDNTGHSSAMPRRDWEVLVHFLEGDPDRPVVLGRVYNGLDPFTEQLPLSKTRTGLRSLSTPTRDGFNEIRFDDAAGREEVFVHAERDQNVRVGNNKTERIMINESNTIGGFETVAVGNNESITVARDMSLNVGVDQTMQIGGERIRVVEGSENSSVKGNRALTIAGNHERAVGISDTVSALSLTEQVGGSLIERTGGENVTEITHAMVVNAAGSHLETAGASRSGSTNLMRSETIGGSLISVAGEELKIGVDARRMTTIGGSMTMNAAEKAFLSGRIEFSSESTTALLDGAKSVTFKVGETTLVMKGGLIQIKSTDTIQLTVSGKNDLGAGESYQV